MKKALKNTEPDAEVVGIVGDYGFQYMVEELAVAAQYNVPYVLIMINNEYLGLIRQASIPYEMNYEVDIHYDEYGTDNVKIMEAYGCSGRRVVEPGDIRGALEWARKEAVRHPAPGAGGDHDRARGEHPARPVDRRGQGVRTASGRLTDR